MLTTVNVKMKDVSYELNNDTTKHKIGDIENLEYVTDRGNYVTGNTALLHVDVYNKDVLYYTDKNGKTVIVHDVNLIN